MINFIKKNSFELIILILWSIITVLQILNHIPWYDEAHAWTLAKYYSIPDLFVLMHQEGHMLIWYLLIMPFAKLNLFYPYPMQFLNWLFCFLALIILWQKSPFASVLKILITFSFPFLVCYSVIARCYSVGIFLLFLLTVYFKEKVNRPILYSILLVLCANTSVMALFGATAFGILFLIELVNSRQSFKNYFIPSILFLIASVIILLPLINARPLILNLNTFQTFLNLLFFGIIFVPLFVYALLNRCFKALFFAIFTYVALTLCFLFVYQGSFWHYFFYIIYWLIVLWLCFIENNNYRFKNYIEILAIIIFAILIFFPITKRDKISTYQLFGKTRHDILSFILNDDLILKSPLIFTYDEKAQSLLNYSQVNENLLINYCSNEDLRFFRQYKKGENANCYTENANKQIVFSQERFDEILDANAKFKNIFFLAVPLNDHNFIYKTSKSNIFEIIEYKSFDNRNMLYQIKKIN